MPRIGGVAGGVWRFVATQLGGAHALARISGFPVYLRLYFVSPRVFYGFKLTAPLNKRSNGFWLDAYGAVRCVFRKSGILRCGSVRFSIIATSTVRFGVVLRNRESYGAVRCGFRSL